MTERVENVIFEGLIHDIEFSRKVLHHIKPEYFGDRVDQNLVKEIKRIFEEHNKAPTQKILKLFVEDSNELKQDEYTKAIELVDSLDTFQDNQEWLINRTEEFCKEKALYNSIVESICIIDGKSKVNTKGAIPKLLSDALAISFDNSVGHDYFMNTEDRFKFYHTKEDRIPFGLDMFNKITKGGVPRKTINVAAGGTNVGKSLFLCSNAADTIRQGFNALYITLEMAEERIAERIDCNLLDVSLDELYKMRSADFSSRLSELQNKSHGRLVIKEYPTGGAHVGHFKALLDELRLKKDFIPDVVYIDYVNICASLKYSGGNNWNSYFAIKAIVEELRGMAVEYNIAVWTATQFNRNGMCLSLDTSIKTPLGDKFLKDVKVGDLVKGVDGYNEVVTVFPISKKRMFKITTESGHSIICSEDHMFPTNHGEFNIKCGLEVGTELKIE